jgi:hypothetical protein
MVKEYFSQYEYYTDYEFDVESVDDIKDERIKDYVLALYKSIDEYTEQKDKMDAKFKKYNKGNKKGYSSDDIIYFCNFHKSKCFGYDWKMNQFISNKNDLTHLIKNLRAFVFYFKDSHIYLM